MPIQFKSRLSSQIANETFLDKTVDDATIGTFSLRNGDNANWIEDVQSFLNTLRADVDTNTTDITNLQSIVEAGEVVIKSYANDIAYESENGSPPYTDKTGIYYNTTSGLLRYYDAVQTSWQDVGKSAVGKHEFLGVGNGLLTDFDLSFLPLTEESFILYKNGVLVPSSEYTFTSPTITFNNAPAAASRIDAWVLTEGLPSVEIITGGTQEVGYHAMNATDISNKQITLPAAPVSATKVMVDLIGGSAQQYGTDYSVSGTTLSWSALGLESVLTVGSVIRYNYFS